MLMPMRKLNLPLVLSVIVLITSIQFAAGSNEYIPVEFNPSEFPRTNLNMLLVATVTTKGRFKAMIKNKDTGAFKSFRQGEYIDIVEHTDVMLLGISNCSILLEIEGRYEALTCRVKTTMVALLPNHEYRPLRRFKVLDEVYKSPPVFKSIYDRQIRRISRKHRVDPYLVKAIIKAESDFNPNAVSAKNARGIMQLMPDTASDYGVHNLFDPVQNMDGGVRLLRSLLDYFYGNKRLALAAYNAGKGSVIKHGYKVPPYDETLNYVERVLGYSTVVGFEN